MLRQERSKFEFIAFTLVELLVVIVIITVLASLLLPSLKKVTDFAKRTACLNNQKQLWLAANSYADAYRDIMPMSYYNDDAGNPARTWYMAFNEFLPGGNAYQDDWTAHRYSMLYICPARTNPSQYLTRNSVRITNYGYNIAYGYYNNFSFFAPVQRLRCPAMSRKVMLTDYYTTDDFANWNFCWGVYGLSLTDAVIHYSSYHVNTNNHLYMDGHAKSLNGYGMYEAYKERQYHGW